MPAEGGTSDQLRYDTLHHLLVAGEGTCKSEFRSPAPPHELSFADSADSVISLFVRTLSATIPAAAPPIAIDGHSATSLHVHVNVRNTTAKGEPLTALQILGVFLAWVRFDTVTSGFARPVCTMLLLNRSPAMCALRFAVCRQTLPISCSLLRSVAVGGAQQMVGSTVRQWHGVAVE
jgi:hypothetical protein